MEMDVGPKAELVHREGGWEVVYYFDGCWIGHTYTRGGAPIWYRSEAKARRVAERWLSKERARAARPEVRVTIR